MSMQPSRLYCPKAITVDSDFLGGRAPRCLVRIGTKIPGFEVHRRPWLESVLVSFLVLGCHRDPSISVPVAKGLSTASAAPSLVANADSSSASAVSDGGKSLNPSWTLAWRAPSSCAELEVPGDIFVSTVIESDCFEEGPLYLERRGSRLQGILDRTIVVGHLANSGTIELRDAVTHLVVFRGRAEGTGKVTGTLFAENEERVVRSSAHVPEPFPEGTFTFSILRTSSHVVSEAKLSRHSTTVSGHVDGYGWLNQAPFGRAAKGTLDSDVLQLNVGPEKWTLRAGPGFFVGRVEPGRDVVVLRDPRKFEKVGEPLPKKVDLGSGQSVVPRAVKNKTINCEVALVIPVIAGVRNATDLNRGFAEQMVNMAMGPSAGDPVPLPEKLRCSPAEGTKSDPDYMGATYEAADLGGGWLNVRLKGYTRTGGRSTAAQDCVLVDSAHGKLYESAELLNEAQRATLTGWVEQRLRMMARNAQLDLDDENYFRNAAPVSDQTALCLTPEGLEVAFNPGEITKTLPALGPNVFIPSKLLARLAIEGSAFAAVLKRQ